MKPTAASAAKIAAAVDDIKFETIDDDRLEGSEAIGRFINPNMPLRTVRRLLEDGYYPCWREGPAVRSEQGRANCALARDDRRLQPGSANQDEEAAIRRGGRMTHPQTQQRRPQKGRRRVPSARSVPACSGLSMPVETARGRPSQGRPHEASAPAERDLLSSGPQGAPPAYEDTASRGRCPPTDVVEQSNDRNVNSGGLHVNGAEPQAPRSPRYSWDNKGMVWHRPTSKGGVENIRLTNFVARIISDITRDDGVEQVRHYEIGAMQGDTSYRFTIPAHQFKHLGWVAEQLGASALVEPGQGMQARVPHAIQVLSGDIPRKHVYCHTGLREIDGRTYFLHAGGALGAKGHRTDIEVDLPKELARVELIEPESDVGSEGGGAKIASALPPCTSQSLGPDTRLPPIARRLRIEHHHRAMG